MTGKLLESCRDCQSCGNCDMSGYCYHPSMLMKNGDSFDLHDDWRDSVHPDCPLLDAETVEWKDAERELPKAENEVLGETLDHRGEHRFYASYVYSQGGKQWLVHAVGGYGWDTVCAPTRWREIG